MRYEYKDNRLFINGEEIQIKGIELLGELGTPGANAAVFKGKDLYLNREVAVKVWLPRRDGKSVRERFMDEISKNARVDEHENIVRVFTGGIIEGEKQEFFYAVMEIVHGQTLKDWLNIERSFQERYSVFRKIYRGAISFSHRKDIYHGDLHTKNIIIKDNNEAKVLDFGTSRFAMSREASLDREKKILIETAIELIHEEKVHRFLDLKHHTVPPWYVRKVLENLGCVYDDLFSLAACKDDEDDYSIRGKIMSVASLITDYPCFHLNNILNYLQNSLRMNEIYLDLFASYVLSVSQAKIEEPNSNSIAIFPDLDNWDECKELYKKWRLISTSLAGVQGGTR